MFVFVHGTLATPSLWLPQIRAILSLGREYSDQELIKLFALKLPGHPADDHAYSYKEFKSNLEEFQLQQYPKQLALAQKLILKGDKPVVQTLQDKKMIVLAHSVGGALTLEYTLKNPTTIKKLVLVSTPARFNQLFLGVIFPMIQSLKFFDQKSILFFSKLMPFKRWRVALDLLRQNKRQLAFASIIKYLRNFDFNKLYSVSSLNQHLALSKIPILLVGGKYDIIAPAQSIRRLHKILVTDTAIMNTKKTIITGKTPLSDPVKSKIYPSGHNSLDTNIVEFCADVRTFLFK
jgi:pimeloyl-ACP methyl ester carboxylesterase